MWKGYIMPWGKELPWKTITEENPEPAPREVNVEPDPVEVWEKFLESNPELQEQALAERRNPTTRPWAGRSATGNETKLEKQARLTVAMTCEIELPQDGGDEYIGLSKAELQAKIDQTAEFIASLNLANNDDA